MSDEPDRESKTEDPSEKRIRDAVEKGNIPFSQEAGILSSIAAILVIGLMTAGPAISGLSNRLGIIIENAATLDLSNGSDAFQIIMGQVWTIFMIALPVLVVISIGGLLGPLLQNVPQANLERLVPKFERISPASNFSRFFGKKAWFDFGKMILKVIAVMAIAYWALMREMPKIVQASAIDVMVIPGLILSIFNALIAPICLVALVIAIVDVVFTRMRWFSDLKMTRQELKDEHKQSEGDPMVKERARQIARQRLRSRMMSDLPRATVVIANPTHYAVALRYAPLEGGAPLVIAKGVDHLALRIREKCEELTIPVVENKPLARSLYAAVDVGEMIPPDFYRAVAEIIHFVDERNRQAAARMRPQA